MWYIFRDHVRGGTKGASAPPEFGSSVKRTERERDNLLLTSDALKFVPKTVVKHY